eukprot:m.362562 g.362562  ORF g.362562 m.362562 type:complete len:379 (-) comp20630_c0_seq1:172-1308(-)
MAQHIVTSMQKAMAAPKGHLEFEADSAFALHVRWIVRSPQAAADMLMKGFAPCGAATLRDTPATATYFFRVSRDQRLAESMKRNVTTIGQHPHYKPAFKQLAMHLPRAAVEHKLRLGEILTDPLDWGCNEPIAPHASELDFDPIVLEATEVYLDDRAFKEHALSTDWMKHHPEIVKPCRSLKPTTYCLGNVSDETWEQVIDPFLQAKRVASDPADLVRAGLQLHWEHQQSGTCAAVALLELDLICPLGVAKECGELFNTSVKKLHAIWSLVIPCETETEGQELSEETAPPARFDLRAMACLPTLRHVNVAADSLRAIQALTETAHCLGRLVVSNTEDIAEVSRSLSGLVDVVSSHDTRQFAGYILHPRLTELVQTPKA